MSKHKNETICVTRNFQDSFENKLSLRNSNNMNVKTKPFSWAETRF